MGGYLPLFGHEEQDGDEADNEEGRYDGEDDDQVVKDAVISCKKKTGALKSLWPESVSAILFTLDGCQWESETTRFHFLHTAILTG